MEGINKDYQMKFKLLNTAITCLLLSLSSFANAGLIEVDFSSGTDSNSHYGTYEEDGFNFFSEVTSDHYDCLANDSRFCFHDGQANSGDNWIRVTYDSGLFDFSELVISSISSGLSIQSNLGHSAFLTSAQSGLQTFNWSNVSYIRMSSADDTTVFIDTFRANMAQVPEPSTLAIFALGMMGLASRRFKK